jgi:hypothetical protein
VANALEERFSEVLLQRIMSDNHPSRTHMDILESIAPPRQRLMYILSLMQRIENDTNPSIPMMQRVQRLIMEFGG